MRESVKKAEIGARLGHKVTLKPWKGHHFYKWRVNYIEQGLRRVKGFPTKVAAEAWAEQRRDESRTHGTSTALTASERSAVIESRERLDALSIDLRSVIERGLTYFEAAAKSCTVSELVAKVIADREAAGQSERYLRDLHYRLGKFEKALGARAVATVTRDEIADWLQRLRLSPASRNNFQRVLRVLFAEGIEGGYLTSNPAASVKAAKVIETEVGILTPAHTAALLAAADDRILPAIAIGAFAGLRDSEIHSLDWSDVDLTGGHIRVRAKAAKSSRNRLIPIAENLGEWLRPQAKTGGPVWPPNGRKLHEAARVAAGLSEWPSNALRHSFGSYALAHRKDAAAVALEMGHKDTGVIFAHYREIVRPDAAAAYWAITPAKAENIVAIR
jgi:integrase